MTADGASGQDRQAVFNAWVQEHAGLVYKVARALAPAEADRQDLIQDILLQLWRSLPRFEGKAKPSTWIYRVALNTALAWRRKESRRRAPQAALIEVDELRAADEDRARRLDHAELVARMYRAIHQLPKLDAALVLLYLDDLSYREMADILGISENHVGVKLSRIRKVLGVLMQEVTHGP